MKRLSIVFVLLVALVGAGLSCSGSQKKDDALTEKQGPPEFFAQIPADSPYVLTGLQPMPEELYLSYLDEYGGTLDEAYAQMQQQPLRQDAPKATKLMRAFVGELAGNMSEEGMKKLGFDTSPAMAVYGIGPLPVMRMTLGDSTKFEAMLGRIEAKAGLTPDRGTVGEAEYRLYKLDADWFAPVAITDDEVIIGMSNADAMEAFLPYMLGQKQPAKSLAESTRLQSVADAYDFEPYYLGYVDVPNFAKMFLGKSTSETAKAMMTALDYQAPQLTPECDREFASFYNAVPRAVMGYEEMSPESMEMLAGLEIQSQFSQKLAGTSAPIPAADKPIFGESLFALGLGIDVRKMVDFLSVEAEHIRNNPYQCKELDQLNQMAFQFQQIPQQIPPVVTSLKGLSLVLQNVELDSQTMQPKTLESMLLVDSADPIGLFSQLQMFLPQLQKVQPKTTGAPVAVPESPQYPWLKSPYVAMTNSTLAFSTGAGMENQMAGLLEGGVSQSEQAPLVLLKYDVERFVSRMEEMGNSGGGMADLGNIPMIVGDVTVGLESNAQGIFMRYQADLNPPEEGAGQTTAAK